MISALAPTVAAHALRVAPGQHLSQRASEDLPEHLAARDRHGPAQGVADLRVGPDAQAVKEGRQQLRQLDTAVL